MFKYILIGLATAVIAFVVNLIIHLGVFKNVDVSVENKPEIIMVFKDHVGPYHKIVPTIEEVEKWAKAENIKCQFTFGEFLDNPKETEELRLRSRAGCILDEVPQSPLPENFSIQKLEQQKYIRAYFTGSPAIGPFKVYDKVYDYANSARMALETRVIEIYEIKSPTEMHTEYLFPMKKE